MTNTAAFAEAKQLVKEAKKKAQDLVKDVFKQGAQEVFNQFPELQSFGWTQYTPYFNDGDACTFRCNADYPSISVLINGELSTYDENYSRFEGEEFDTTLYDKSVTQFLKQFDDDDFLFMFDDHAQVKVNRDGTIDVEEYEHD